MGRALCQSGSHYCALCETLRHRHRNDILRLNEPVSAIYGGLHLFSIPLSRSGRFLLRKSCISIRSTLPDSLQTGLATGFAHTECDQPAIRQCSDAVVSGSLLPAAPVVQCHYLVHISLRTGCGHDLYHIRTVIDTFLDYCLQSLKRIRALEIVVRTDEDSAVLVGRSAHSLGHLLLGLDLHINISRASLYGPYKPLFRHLHGLYPAALLRQILQRRFFRRNLAYAAGRHQRHIRGKEFFDLPCCQVTSVETDLRHLTLIQSLIYLLQGTVLYGCTNHLLTSIT